ncbi:MAG: hypothetical protein QHH04_08090 [Methanolinea sp.]|jgi:hypothetical protein|nr:hypothetical protein [Methanolinea sp.]
MKEGCLETDNTIITAISEIEDAFFDIESIKTDIRNIQYELAELDRKLHAVTLRLKEVQSFLGTVCAVPPSESGGAPQEKTFRL